MWNKDSFRIMLIFLRISSNPSNSTMPQFYHQFPQTTLLKSFLPRLTKAQILARGIFSHMIEQVFRIYSSGFWDVILATDEGRNLVETYHLQKMKIPDEVKQDIRRERIEEQNRIENGDPIDDDDDNEEDLNVNYEDFHPNVEN